MELVYTDREKSIFDRFLHLVGVKKIENKPDIAGLIDTTTREIERVETKGKKYLALISQESRDFLKLLMKLEKGPLTTEEQAIYDAYLKTLHVKPIYKKLENLHYDYPTLRYVLGQLEVDRTLYDCFLSKLEQVITFSKKEKLIDLAPKAKALFDRFKLETPIEENSKLTLREFSLFDLLPSVHDPIFAIFKKNGALKAVQEVYDAFVQMRTLKKEMVQEIRKELEESPAISSGSFSFVNVYNVSFIRKKKRIGFRESIQMIFCRSKFIHTAIVYKNLKKDRFNLSHVCSSHTKNKLGFFGLTSSEFFSLDWKKLISLENQEKLESLYGKEWEREVELLYEESCSTFHGKTNFSDIENGSLNQINSVLRLPFQFTENDPDRFTFNNRQMFCSQFAAMSTEVTLSLLDKKLAERLDLKDDSPSRIVNSPFHKRTNFGAMHPGRLERVLRDFCKPTKPLLIVEKMVNNELTAQSPLKKIIS